VSTWRILEWSRERGRGATGSPHFPRVEFDAACADVDDFAIDERVHVELDAAMKVRRIWPDLPRFRAPAGVPAAPELDEGLREDAESAVAAANGWTDARVRIEPSRVRLELDDDGFAYGPSVRLDALDPRYVELPMALALRFVRLADLAAREYLATRVDLTALDIAIALIDESDRFYFVVAGGLELTRRRSAG
jgi:hypothetical protein